MWAVAGGEAQRRLAVVAGDGGTDARRRRLALAARRGRLAASELLTTRGLTAELDAVGAGVLAVRRGESGELPALPRSAEPTLSSRSTRRAMFRT